MSKMSKHAHFEALVRTVSTELNSYALWLARDKALADDLVQETLLRAWKSLHTLRDASAAKYWLMTILRREHARHYERKRLETVDINEPTFPEVHLATKDEDPEIDELRRFIFELDDDYREPLTLQVLLGYSTSEIAEIMELSQGAVLTRLFRARKKLQARLEKAGTRSRQVN